jgi:hypothetical protein
MEDCGTAREGCHQAHDHEKMQTQPKRLPIVPLLVLSAGERLDWLAPVNAKAWQGQQLQRELATLSSMGEWIPVPGANHYIHLSLRKRS